MKFGICTSINNADALKKAGFDYVEENVQSVLQGTTPDASWSESTAGKSLPALAANCLVPGDIKITGPQASLDQLTAYMTNVLTRAGKTGIKTLVFGSGGARNVPDGFDRNRARGQILDFLNMAAPIAQKNGVTIVAEPLNKGECNIINSVGEAMTYVKEINHPGFQCLVDSYHFWLEDEPLSNLEAAMPWIKHVHLADKVGRVGPGLSGQSDYVPFFSVLKKGGYSGLISYEGKPLEPFDTTAPGVLKYIMDNWAKA